MFQAIFTRILTGNSWEAALYFVTSQLSHVLKRLSMSITSLVELALLDT